MKTPAAWMTAVALVAVAAGGYWAGSRSHAEAPPSIAAGAAGDTPASAAKPRKLLYYRNPMGLADTSPTPKKDPMGMDYIPVYEGEEEGGADTGAANQVRISTEKIQKLGVRFEAVQRRTLGRTARAAGRVEPDERRLFAIAPKYEGYVERLHVNVTGQPVAKGQPLFEVYSPELVSAQREYVIATQGVESMKAVGGDALASMKQLAESSLTRLRNWDLSPEQIAQLVRTGEARRTLTFRSPVAGVVTEKKALQGMRFMPGEALYQVTDLSSVWILADVFEQDIGLVKRGTKATATISAYPGQSFEGVITYVYPTLNADTRTVPVRVEIPNRGGLLKPAMFAQVDLPVGAASPVLAVPESAVIDSGKRRIVLVQVKEGRFEPREVALGARSDRWVEVREGVREGEQVVVAANFLIDAESNLKAALGGLGGHAGHGAPAGGKPAQDVQQAPGAQGTQPAPVGHKAEGKVEAIDTKAGTVTMQHGAVSTLGWPAMTMEFKVANASLLERLRPGAPVGFEFVERQPGEWLITAIRPLVAPKRAGDHTGH